MRKRRKPTEQKDSMSFGDLISEHLFIVNLISQQGKHNTSQIIC